MTNRQKIGAIIFITFFILALGLAGKADFTSCQIGGMC